MTDPTTLPQRNPRTGAIDGQLAVTPAAEVQTRAGLRALLERKEVSA